MLVTFQTMTRYNWKWLHENEIRESRVFVSRPAWHKATATNIDLYKNLSCNLNSLCLPTTVLTCNNLVCGCTEHAKLLNNYAKDIVQCCVDDASSAIPITCPKNCNENVPGWTEYICPVREKSLFWHNIWMECGRP